MSARYYALACASLLCMQGAQAAPQVGTPTPAPAAVPSSHPPAAIAAKRDAMVIVKTFVGTDGTASQARVETSSGYPDLDEKAVKAVSQYHFNPHIGKNGKPDSGYAIIPVKFVLPTSKSS
ncbi:energy transducer TonB [Luteibacter sp.]|uniref:energy transducer TonB n=1 Tax=Luteibacter sp. TaxID=1886636 RepID=UPI0025C670EB|nr:energy transducer TonB [Luteibacter sp.]